VDNGTIEKIMLTNDDIQPFVSIFSFVTIAGQPGTIGTIEIMRHFLRIRMRDGQAALPVPL
jgi:hypothetical protein